MILPFLRRGFRSCPPAEERLSRLCKVLKRMNIDHDRDGAESALRRLPSVSPPRQTRQRFVQKLRFPVVMPARVALFEGGFAADGAVRMFAASEASKLGAFVPEAIVAPLQTALTLADQKQRGLLNFPTLSTAFIVLTSLDGEPLADNHRDLLWHVFQVPVFEQLRGWDGAVLASECEVHDGLHIDPTAVIPELHAGELVITQLTEFTDPIVRVRTHLTAEIVNDHCECGLETPRLRNLSYARPRARVAMAG